LSERERTAGVLVVVVACVEVDASVEVERRLNA